MGQPIVWYDTCPVCQGRGAIPCHECSGVGQSSGTEHGQAGIEHERATVASPCTCPGCACVDCGGTGAERCTACHGQGMRGLPAYPGTYC